MATTTRAISPMELQDRDLVDPIGFIRQLCDKRYPSSNHLMQLLDATLLEQLWSTVQTSTVESNLKRELLDALNKLLPGECIFDLPMLKDIGLTEETRKLLQRRSPGQSCAELNRRLLAEAYPWSIAIDIQPRTPEWHKYQVAKFGKLHDRYGQYAEVLRRILEKACTAIAPLAIVYARAKTVSSFAEKTWRKAKYTDPLYQITDLCGARIITETGDDVERMCEYIRDHFLIDEANSLDAQTRLSAGEFGYLSMHYIVQLSDEFLTDTTLMDKETAKALRGLKTEIQVRTLLQHAWASISHDRIYKSEFTVPDNWRRELARVAALLEHADSSFGTVVKRLDTYKGYYGAYMTDEKVQQEVATLETILANEPDEAKKPAIALQTARLAKARWDWQRIIAVLDPYLRITAPERAKVLTEHGNALCHQHRCKATGAGYLKGVQELEQARHIAEDPKTRRMVDDQERNAIYASLAWSYGNLPGEELQARNYYRQAYDGDPSNPYSLASHLQYEIFCLRHRDFISHMHHVLRQALQQCRAHVEAGIELPWAYLTMGKLYLLLGQHYDALGAYAKAISRCLCRQQCYPREILEDERKFIANINFGQPFPEEDRWVDDLLLLALAVKFGDSRAKEELARRRVWKGELDHPIVIVAGGTDESIAALMTGYRECLQIAFDRFQGTVFSGGTTSGIPGIIGEIGAQSHHPPFRLLAYRPHALPYGAVLSAGYDEHLPTEGADFSPRQPLQNWIDLIAAGVDPATVKVLGINGGKLALLEYQLALAMGATVGVVEYSGRAVTDLHTDPDWHGLPNLLWIPFDNMSVRAFIDPGHTELKPEKREEAGKAVHEEFLRENRHRLTDPSMLSWKELRPDLKAGNIEQAQYSTTILRCRNYTIRALADNADPSTVPDGEMLFPQEDIDVMAEMEHGRWVIERLRAGWQYGPERDAERKISPYLLPWRELPEYVKDWDRKAVTKWPAILAKAGLEVYK